MFQWTKHIICVLLCFSSAVVLAQSKEELQDTKEQLQNEIKLTNDLLNEARKEKKTSINRLSTLKRKITARDEMINTLVIEIGLYAKGIQQLEQEVFIAEERIVLKQVELQSLKEEYAKLIYHAYHNRGGYDRLAFIFTAHSFHQAYKRIKYFQQYSQFRQQQVKLIKEKEVELETELLSLKQNKAMLLVEKNIKAKVLGNTEREKQKLDSEKGEQQSLFNDLAKKEKQLKTELKEKEQQAKALDVQIRKIIEEEIRKAKEASASTGTPFFSMTPEQKELAENFTTNKGTLPWPVERGVITERFGKQKHPVLAGIETYNNGVKITTEKGASARAIFDGTVSRILNIPGAGKAIILSHGDYFSVYNNLSDVFITAGQSIKTKQEIGLVSTNSSTNETITELQIWKGNKKLNPAQWIYRAY